LITLDVVTQRLTPSNVKGARQGWAPEKLIEALRKVYPVGGSRFQPLKIRWEEETHHVGSIETILYASRIPWGQPTMRVLITLVQALSEIGEPTRSKSITFERFLGEKRANSIIIYDGYKVKRASSKIKNDKNVYLEIKIVIKRCFEVFCCCSISR